MTVICDYCGQTAQFVNSSEVYRVSYGMIYYCPACQAWVGVHKGTDKPLGRLANARLRELKKSAHKAFDPLWKRGAMKRDQAYIWLAQQMAIPFDQAHIGLFDIAECQKAIKICNSKIERGTT